MGQIKEVKVPDIGDFDDVEVIEVLVSAGDEVEKEDSLITLESDKASMDVPSPQAGTVKELNVSSGDKVAQGDVILTLETGEDEGSEEPEDDETDEERDGDDETDETSEPDTEDDEDDDEDSEDEPEAEAEGKERPSRDSDEDDGEEDDEPDDDEDDAGEEPSDHEEFKHAHASPAVRRFARELGADLANVEGSGRKGRVTREDVRKYVKAKVQQADESAPAGAPEGTALPPMPEIDFSQFGEVEEQELSRIRKRSAQNLHRSWLHVPHVTQFDAADATELEAFRQELKPEAEERGVKMTFLPFLMKAVVAALQEFPTVNSSLAPGGESLILKKYYHLGIAVDTDDGLIVPVVRDVDTKGLFELAGEVADVADRARNRKLKPEDLKGASFTITSLGGIGGTAFTPIVNAPEVGILGVSRMETKPVWQDGEFAPRKMLPLSFSYDHRVIDGALAARFTVYLSKVLSDLRRILL